MTIKSNFEIPFQIFSTWMSEAKQREVNDPNAMALATTDTKCRPSVRMVLLKDFSPNGFVFYTSLDSYKGKQLRQNPWVGLCFHWKSLQRQVRIEGMAEQILDAEADAYFSSRPRESQIGAWASLQSQPLISSDVLEKRVKDLEVKFCGQIIPRPPYWSGFRVVPLQIEFWEERPFRLHHRVVYTRHSMDQKSWKIDYLYP